VAELHDMFTILEFLQSEDLGFFEKGEGGRRSRRASPTATASSRSTPPAGSSRRGTPRRQRVAQVYEIFKQVTGDAGPRQVEADTGLACNVGGFGNCVTTTILEGNQ